MTKMNMVWVAVAKLLHPNTDESTVIKDDIDRTVQKLFNAEITPVMITRHLVSSVDRQADKQNPQRGGSRNRYLFEENGRFRLYKNTDAPDDGYEKDGPTCPSAESLPDEYRDLVTWYKAEYQNS